MNTSTNPSTDPGPTSPNDVLETRRPRLSRAMVGLSALAVVATAGVAGTTLAGADESNRSPDVREAHVVADGLGNTTLDELADELADLGLTVRIEPSTLATPSVQPEGEVVDPVGDPQSDDVGQDEDPFAGMTDAEVDALSDEEFFALLDEAGIDYEELDDGFADDDDAYGDEEVLGAFEVNGDSIDVSNASSPEVAEQARSIWTRFVTLIPAEQRQMVSSFELNPAEASGAYVYPAEEDPTKWVLGVSLELGEDLDYVLIHEFGHLLTLQATEVPPAPDADPDSCPTYFTGEGCALSGTTMANFVQKFWPQAQIDEIARLQDAEDYDGLDAFYDEHRDDFVTDYATTNPAEDLAETFAVFVTEERPAGDTIADQKVNLLWSDPEMVALRTEIRANL
ncbi:MAG: hypothetical protein R8J94_12840 [Acidimicrobiia bacterium]|nr:hypothetical protein [Acidimicrobiia bacterium]